MKKYSLSLLAASVLAAGAAQADSFNIAGGLDYMYSDMDGSAEGKDGHRCNGVRGCRAPAQGSEGAVCGCW